MESFNWEGKEKRRASLMEDSGDGVDDLDDIIVL
jgi:hypothetical protein